MIDLESLDHMVLTVLNIERTTNFYSNILGLELYVHEGRYGARIGDTLIKFRLVTDKALVARSIPFNAISFTLFSVSSANMGKQKMIINKY